MAASSLQDLFNFEAHFESAAITFVDAAIPSGYATVGTLSEATLTTPRVEVALQLGDAAGPPAPRNGGASPNNLDFREYGAIFQASVVTDNAVGQTSVDHATTRADIRALLLYSGANWDNTTLPYYDLKWIRPMDQSYLTNDDFNVTEMAWELKFEIRDDAWPS